MTTTYDTIETAMCLWEAVMEIRERPEVLAQFEAQGTSTMRWSVAQWIPQLNADWAKVWDNYGGDFDGSFDWDFVPDWIHNNVDWADMSVKARPTYFHLGADA